VLFGELLSEQQILEAKAAGREALLTTILSDFRRTFPTLTFELQLAFRGINALAMTLRERRTVTVYGGLAFHPCLTDQSFSFVLLHEAGHHLAKGCRLSRDPSLACECAADHWAVTSGAELLYQRTRRSLDIEKALSELSAVMGTRHKPDTRYSKKKIGCWAKTWSLRRCALSQRIQPPTSKGCYLRLLKAKFFF
jgi:hypothetical protein